MRAANGWRSGLRSGDLAALLALLDPDVVLRADTVAAQPALVNGAAGLVWAPGGRPRVVFRITIERGRIVAIDLVADPQRLRRLDLVTLSE